MFEELRGLPPKPQKVVTKKRKGCLKAGYGFLVVFIAIVIGIILLYTSLDFSSVQDYNTLSKELSVEVNESEIAPNKVEQSDFNVFINKINESITNTKGLSFFDENNKMLLDSFLAEDIVFNQDITVFGKDIACLGSLLLEAGLIKEFESNFTLDALSIIEFDISCLNQKTDIKAILKIKPQEMFENYESLQNKYNFPNIFYVISTFKFDNLTNEILSANIKINNLSEKSNNLLLTLLAGSKTQASADEIVNFCKKPAQIFLELLDEFKTKYNTVLVFNGNSITALKAWKSRLFLISWC